MMKKLLCLTAMLAFLGILALPAGAEPVNGFIYKNATEAGEGFSQTSVYKTGKAECKSYFALVALGNCSVNEAAKNGKIKNVSYFDTHTRNILGYKKVTVQVYGN